MAQAALAVVVVASLVGGAARAQAIELGELQSVPSHAPPYIFRLPLVIPPHGPAATAAVKVRQPPDTIAFVKQQTVELRLRSVTDVELEVSYGGQTLNRLLPKGELQAARMRADMAPASNPSPPAGTKGRDRSLPEVLTASQTPAEAFDRRLVEHEIEGIRREIHSLVERVAPWDGLAAPIWDRVEGALSGSLTLILGGFFSVGATWLIMGYVRQRRAIDRERRRQRALTLSIRRMRDQLAAGVPILSRRPPALRSRTTPEALAPVAIIPQGRLAQRTRRRLRVWAPSHRCDVSQEPGGEHVRLRARVSQRVPLSPTDLLAALVQLRGELMRLQGRLPTPVIQTDPEAGSGGVPR
jgi:hypothetical protein